MGVLLPKVTDTDGMLLNLMIILSSRKYFLSVRM
jgi:hypothetical protein